MNQLQVIYDSAGKPAFAVIPWDEYERLTCEEAEALLIDAELYDLAKKDASESFPVELVDRLLAGENPVLVYRTHRNMTQSELAAAAEIDPLILAQIESGQDAGSTEALTSLSKALGISPEDLR